MAEGFGIGVGALEERMPIFLHGPVAAEMARERYGIEDPEILEAVRVHTMGRVGMGPVARVVFLADKLDPTKDRRYPFNSEVREVARSDLEPGDTAVPGRGYLGARGEGWGGAPGVGGVEE